MKKFSIVLAVILVAVVLNMTIAIAGGCKSCGGYTRIRSIRVDTYPKVLWIGLENYGITMITVDQVIPPAVEYDDRYCECKPQGSGISICEFRRVPVQTGPPYVAPPAQGCNWYEGGHEEDDCQCLGHYCCR